MDRRRLIVGAAAAAAAARAVPLHPAAAASEDERLSFPTGFLWGTATSSYQVEGRGDRKADTIWDSFARVPGTIKDGSNGDVACDDVNRYAEDIGLIAQAGLKAYRFSISWARVLPDGTGQPDQTGLDYYSRVTDALLKAGIEPWVCLFHWDLPQALQDRGGWSNRAIAQWFADYTGLMAHRLGDRVTHWATFNEPNVHAVIGHGLGEHAPGMRSRDAMFAAFHHQNLAHGDGVAALRAVGGDRFKIGTVISLQPVRPAEGDTDKTGAANTEAAALWDALWNRVSLDPPILGRYPERMTKYLEPLVQGGDLARIKQRLDFLGVNYYSPMYQRADPDGLIGTTWGATPAGMPQTAMGWPVDPNGLHDVLADLRDNYGNPALYITENGACYPDTVDAEGRVDDRQRIAFLHDHIAMCHRVIAEKVDLRGYFAWTILDNFEWAKGYTAPFGLVRVDRKTLKRTPKASYAWFAQVAQNNSLATDGEH
ncbi:MAG TPA: GH1 family beta-glucosidase [Stellaceae bacterium]|jgi:beta-glucosidase|nr:GH1 family beta-glucosidase [Stellaceae bacterium]